MWTLVKYEFKYNRYYIVLLAVFFFIYTLLSIYNLKLTLAPAFETDYWSEIYGIIIYAFMISIWGTRLKEKRILSQSLLPISQCQNSLSRFWMAALPLLGSIFYLVLVHLIIIDVWHDETGSLIAQVGVCFILLAGYIRGRDDWFSYWNFGKRSSAAFVAVLIIQVVVVFVFLGLKDFNMGLVGLFGSEAIHYAKLIFPLLGFVILVTSIFSFRKRRSYLL